MLSNSKKISKIDDSSKKFIMDCLGGNNTYGFDIDSIYFVNGQWYLFEYLKCENEHIIKLSRFVSLVRRMYRVVRLSSARCPVTSSNPSRSIGR